MSEIYTIGYSGFEPENFVRTLKNYGINCLVDVRSNPHSAYFKDFDKERISKRLQREKILYRNYSAEFGARQTDENFFTDGVLDFSKFALSPIFEEGVKKIEAGISIGCTFAFMCAEKRPEVCHRSILVARNFYEHGHEIRNILSDGKFIRQDEVENILLDKYFPDRNQISLFEEPSTEEMIKSSYEKRGREIAYRKEDDEY